MSDYWPPHAGSFVPFVKKTLALAIARGWETTAVFPDGAQGRSWFPEFAELGVDARISPPDANRRELAHWTGHLLDERPVPTVVHTHFTRYDVPAVLAARKRPGVIVFWHVHTVLSEDRRAVVANALKMLTFGREVHEILCPAQNIADGLGRRLGPRSKIRVFPSPIDAEDFPLLDADQRLEARRAVGIPPDETVLLSFSRDWKIKGGDTFLAAAQMITAKRDEDVLAVAHHGGEPARAEALTLGFTDSLLDIGHVERIQLLFGAADVFLAPSRGEGMPFSVLESLCTGTPVVASDLPGHRFLPEDIGALYVVPRDPGRVADAALGILERGREQALAECREARKWIKDNLGLEPAAEGIMEDYESALAGSRPLFSSA